MKQTLLQQVKTLVETERMMVRDEIRRREREIEHLRQQLSSVEKKNEKDSRRISRKKSKDTLDMSSSGIVFPGELDNTCENVCHETLRVVILSQCSLDARCASPIATLCSYPFRVASLDLDTGRNFEI